MSRISSDEQESLGCIEFSLTIMDYGHHRTELSDRADSADSTVVFGRFWFTGIRIDLFIALYRILHGDLLVAGSAADAMTMTTVAQ